MTGAGISTVYGFGDEWSRFDQTSLPEDELQEIFSQYFKIFPWHVLPANAVGFDLGCGSGRWARYVAPRVGKLHCIDASAIALNVAKKNLEKMPNCEFHVASVDHIPFEDNSMDFGYSLGVLGHIPYPLEGIKDCVTKLKKGVPFLLYTYYAFDSRPLWFLLLWYMTDLIRKIISKSPYGLRYRLSQIIAVLIYFPLARLALLLEKLGFNVDSWPLSLYRHRSFIR